MKMIVRPVLRYLIFLFITALSTVPSVHAQTTDTLWLHKIDMNRYTQDWNLTPKAYLALKDHPLKIAGKTFYKGLATPTEKLLKVDLNGNALRFRALVGLDDASRKTSLVIFSVQADGKEVFRSPKMTHGKKARVLDLNVEGVKQLTINIEDEGKSVFADKADFANAYILYKGTTPSVLNFNFINKRYALTPPESPAPKINGAKVFGVRPGHPFLFRVAATGKRPMTFAAENLPNGISLDPNTGIITGALTERGESLVTLKASNELGTATRTLKIVVGDRIALTPPMGWNGYNRFADSIDDITVRKSADAMISTGLVNHGWVYINIDDGWSMKPGSNDPLRNGAPRDANGMINPNGKFPDMKGMTDYIHAKGLKAGLYSSPGYLTCSKYAASYQYEDNDALQWAKWGFDYIKYDYCSYGEVAKSNSLETQKKPYGVLRKSLDKVDRDIVFSFSQYGVGDTWKWGDSIGGNSWRTTGDLIDTWQSVSEIGFTQVGLHPYAGPGHWNDPDMLVVGLLGWGEVEYPSRLRADEQYTHISLWSLLAAPLMIGCDISKMDAFTKNLFTNDEVIEINQDPLGRQAAQLSKIGDLEIWAKDMEDGTKAVGLFNRSEHAASVKANWKLLGLSGKQTVRDVWRQKDEGVFTDAFSAVVPGHGVKLITIRKAK